MSKELSVDEKLLKEVIGDENAEIFNLEVKNLVEVGENFVGILKGAKFSAGVNGKTNAYDIVIKFARKMETPGLDISAILFHKEISFYRKFIPYIENWQKEKFGSVYTPIPAPNSLFGCFERRLLVLDNLRQYGFRNALKKFGLNYQRCCATVKTVAAFHALGVSFVQDYGESCFISDFDYFQDMFLSFLENDEMMKVMRDMHDKMLESIDGLLTKTYPDEVGDIKDMIKYGKMHFIADNIKKYSVANEKFNVICHGDLWTNNIMFKFDEHGNPIDVKFIDYQVLRYGTPASDLIYFIWNSGDKEVLVDWQNEILKIYYDALKMEFEKFNLELSYTLDDLKEDYYSFIDFGIIQCLRNSLMFDVKKEDALDLDEGDNFFSDEGQAKFSSKVNQLANVASDIVKDKLINVVRYGKRMKLY